MHIDHQEDLILGVIGGSGLYQIDSAKIIDEHVIKTPFGDPSDHILEVELSSRRVFFLPRHGRGHGYSPSEIPYQANIAALKKCGVTHIISISAVGILQDGIQPGEMIIPNQLIDLTKGIRKPSFFCNGVVGHQVFADPFCYELSEYILSALKTLNRTVHHEGTYICIEGPRFSTRAESLYFKNILNGCCIGMTAHPEAALAREAEISYSLLALATDYDCWHGNEDDVSVAGVLEILKQNQDIAKKTVVELAKILPSKCRSHLKGNFQNTLLSSIDSIPEEAKNKFRYLFDTSII